MLLTITRRHVEAERVVSLDLGRPDGAELPPWQPGAHIDVHLTGGLVRQYSLCSSPSRRDSWRIAVLRETDGRGGSVAACALAEGDVVQVSDPRNHFDLVDAPRYLFVAGGIGITPILPMIASVQERGVPWHLVYGGRTRSAMAFTDELDTYGEQVSLVPEDELGRIDLASALSSMAGPTAVYACGPGPMLDAAESMITEQVLATLHVERFTARELSSGTVDEPFEVEFAASGITRTVAAGESILEVAEKEGLDVFSSCEQGTCGTCVTPVLSGRVDHRDSLLTPAEQARNDVLCICVSRAVIGAGLLRLDL